MQQPNYADLIDAAARALLLSLRQDEASAEAAIVDANGLMLQALEVKTGMTDAFPIEDVATAQSDMLAQFGARLSAAIADGAGSLVGFSEEEAGAALLALFRSGARVS